VSLCAMLPSRVCRFSVSTSQCTLCFYVTLSTTVFYSLPNVCHYLTLYSLFVLFQYGQFSLLYSVHCLSVTHTVPPVGSVSHCPLLPSTVCPLPFSMSRCTLCWGCVTVSTAVL
jgi:hypothetical protein